ncbi:hypothetical protein GGR21_000009 [Dysgonomonas hofstadii]|uniref:Uncharacterized protein n=1 Tax=Dysgonomonas hofstadii TaxID=637886 RepID=A0A840CL28_9BACT|nr:hypothetical protein [Dysgonomonas hofstadii]
MIGGNHNLTVSVLNSSSKILNIRFISISYSVFQDSIIYSIFSPFSLPFFMNNYLPKKN